MAEEDPQHHEGFGKPPRVLLAEDDRELRRLLCEALQAAGYAVSEVDDGGRLLVRLGQAYQSRGPEESFDLILSDVRMPVCTGLQIVEALRQTHCRIPVILITAFGDETTRAKARCLGAVLVDKPFDVDELVSTVRRLLMRHA